MRIVITGPTGAIGHAIIEECIERNIDVLAVCRKGSSRINTIPVNPLVKILELNMDEYRSCDELPYGGYDVFFHFAWDGTIGDGRNNTDLQSRNIEYSLDAVRLAKKLGCSTFIGAGSQAEYGRVEGVLREDTPVNPENGYGIAKLCAGSLTRLLCEQLEMRHIWTRILSIYGPYDGEKTMVISSLRKMLKGEKVSFTAGEQYWDYLYSSDAAKAMLLLGEKGISGKTYIISSGKAAKLKDYISVMAEKTKTPVTPGLGDIPYSDKQVMYLCGDINELQTDTGFVPSVSFEDGIQRVIDYVNDTQI